MGKRLSVLIGGVGGLLMALAVPVVAHHAFSAEYDSTKAITLRGTVKKMEWINPHSWMTLEVKGADGKVETWEIETGAPNSMFRRGFNRDSLPLGTELIVHGYQAKSGKNRANGGSVTFPDGRTLFLGGSNPDDPENKK
jgi:uncharacterized protein DUF6152